MESFLHFVMTFVGALAAAVGILLGAFLIFLLIARISDRMQHSRRDFGQIACGGMMLLLGLGFLWSARSALLYHTTIYFKGWMYPWQAIIGGGLSAAFGLFLIIRGIYRTTKPGGDN